MSGTPQDDAERVGLSRRTEQDTTRQLTVHLDSFETSCQTAGHGLVYAEPVEHASAGRDTSGFKTFVCGSIYTCAVVCTPAEAICADHSQETC